MDTSAIQEIKQRYHIVGRDEKLDTALDTALQVASTDLSVLIQGESGVGKEIIPRIIHDASHREVVRRQHGHLPALFLHFTEAQSSDFALILNNIRTHFR